MNANLSEITPKFRIIATFVISGLLTVIITRCVCVYVYESIYQFSLSISGGLLVAAIKVKAQEQFLAVPMYHPKILL
jgi:hypothetical protein